VVPAEGVIARTNDVAVSLGCLWVYPTGFEFDVFADLGNERDALDRFLFDRRPQSENEKLLLGFEFADGAKASTYAMVGAADSTQRLRC
jgi:hypothetical protein